MGQGMGRNELASKYSTMMGQMSVKCHPKWYVIICLHVSEVHLEKSRRNGAQKSPACPVWSKAHQWLSASLPSPATGEEGQWLTFWHYGQGKTTHVTPGRCTLTHNILYLQRKSRESESFFLSYCQSDEKVALTGKIKMARGTDVSLVISLSISPVDAAQTPLGCRHTSGKNCHRDATVPGVIKNEFSCCDVNTNDLSHDAFA